MFTKILDHQSPILEPDQPDNILVCLLGSFRLLLRGQPLDLLMAGKSMTLLSELALRLNEGVRREELLEILWPEQDTVHSTVSLNSLIYSLQRRLRDHFKDATALVYTNGCYSLNKEAGFSTDIAHFDAYVRCGAWLAASGAEPAAVRAYEQAVLLYRGDLCVGSNLYAVVERERLRASFLSVLAWLADHAYRERDDVEALERALLLLKYDPCREDAHRLVMRIRVRRGERAEALRHYRMCENVLRQEFDVAPETLTRELFEQIRAGSGQG